MNSTAPPSAADNQWLDLNIEEILSKANEEVADQQDATSASTSTKAPEGLFARSLRFFKTLGKRKEREGEEKKDTRRELVEQAYADAKALGLLPEPKVFTRPYATPRTRTAPSTPRPSISTPALRASTSKKDLSKQFKLSKRVSSLELRLYEARRALCEALGEDVPPVPALPVTLPPTPDTSTNQFFSEDRFSPEVHVEEQESAVEASAGKIVKKRKVITTTSDEDYKPVTTDTDSEYGSEHVGRKSRTTVTTTETTANLKAGTPSKSQRRRKGRASRKKSVVTKEKEEVVTVVPNGKSVPPLPKVPSGVEGKRAAVRDDGFGGLGHEIF
jgi:hypothetical protein